MGRGGKGRGELLAPWVTILVVYGTMNVKQNIK
jgi:hypothetical protein